MQLKNRALIWRYCMPPLEHYQLVVKLLNILVGLMNLIIITLNHTHYRQEKEVRTLKDSRLYIEI